MNDILRRNKDGTERLISWDGDRRDGYFGDAYVIFYKNYPVYVEVDRLILAEGVDWSYAESSGVCAVIINTNKIRIKNPEWRWYKIFTSAHINYAQTIPFNK